MPSSLMPSKVLRGRTVLLVCSTKLLSDLSGGIEALGGMVLPFPVIETREIEDKEPLDRAIVHLQEYDWIIFTSAYGVTFFSKRMQELGIAKTMPAMPKICTIGPATASAVDEHGFSPTLVARKFLAEGVLAALESYHGGRKKLRGLRILLPRALEAREFLPDALTSAGSSVDVVPCYISIRPKVDTATLELLREKRPDLIVFTSASAIRNMVETLGSESSHTLLREATVAVIGPVTAKAAELQGKHAEIVPAESTAHALLKAIGDYFTCV